MPGLGTGSKARAIRRKEAVGRRANVSPDAAPWAMPVYDAAVFAASYSLRKIEYKAKS